MHQSMEHLACLKDSYRTPQHLYIGSSYNHTAGAQRPTCGSRTGNPLQVPHEMKPVDKASSFRIKRVNGLVYY